MSVLNLINEIVLTTSTSSTLANNPAPTQTIVANPTDESFDNSVNDTTTSYDFNSSSTQNEPSIHEEQNNKKEDNTAKKDVSQFEYEADYYNEIAKAQNEQDKEEIHGMSDQEYQDLVKIAEEYDIDLEDLSHGNFSNVAAQLAQGIDKGIYDEIAASYDSVLDLVLDEKFNNAMAEIYVKYMGGSESAYSDGKASWKWEHIMQYADVLRDEYGINVESVTTGNYTEVVLSLIDENGNVIQDANGNLAQVKKSDNLLPDGSCQNVEKFASGVLDKMGYDCVSFLDLTPEEYEKIKEMAMLDNSELGTASEHKANYISYKERGFTAKSKDAWNAQKESYFANVKYYANSTSSNSNSTTNENKENNIKDSKEELKSDEAKEKDSKEAKKKDSRTKISETEFNKKVEEAQNEDSLSEQEAIEVVSKEFYYTNTQGEAKV